MRIISVYYTHKPGGFCKRLYRLSNALVQRKHEVHYLSLDPPPAIVSREVRYSRIPFPIKKRSGIIFWSIFSAWAPLWIMYKAICIRPDRYLAFGAYYSAIMQLAKLVRPAPLILFVRSLVFKIDRISGKPRPIRWISERLEKYGILSANRVISLTNTMQSALEEFVGRSLPHPGVLYNDLPPLRERSKLSPEFDSLRATLKQKYAEEDIVVLTSGVFTKRKNLTILLEAFHLLQSKGVSAVLIVCGSGKLLDKYKEEAKELGLTQIEFIGWCDFLEELFPLVDLVVHPSLHEGIANSILEAIAYDVPVLVADTPEQREVFDVAEALFDPTSVDDLATKLYRFIEDQSFRSKLEDGIRRVGVKLDFDWEQAASDLIVQADS
ncbi:MAG: glycosyltransferase family 4 protein [Bdellovibrionales bacterium]|nr:glycosyltransferase family 4 protein [Bdellovibrionales bacterium]